MQGREWAKVHFYYLFKGVKITEQKSRRPKAEHLVNEAIPYKSMFVVSQTGEKLGMMNKRDAVEKAKSLGYDLVIISENDKQPVAKILDYGKFKYERKKKRKEAKTNQVVVDNREIRLTPMIGLHDLLVKSKKAREFIMKGDRVKISLKFRGREMTRKDLGYDKLQEFFKTLEDVAKIDKEPVLNQRFLDMHISRDKTKIASQEAKKEDKDAKNEDKVGSKEKSQTNS